MKLARLIDYRVKIQDIWEKANLNFDFELSERCKTACKRIGKEVAERQKEESQEEPKKHAGGRPRKEDKKIQINVKLPPYLVHVMDMMEDSRAVLIEKAVLEYVKKKKKLKQVDLFGK